jgi:uroporphyrinogen-III synthase
MVAQSRAVPVVLTRPAVQSARFAKDLRDQLGGKITLVESPLLAPTFLQPVLGAGPWKAVIFTSETAVTATGLLGSAANSLPRKAYCVGDRTAEAARKAGFIPLSAKGNSDALCAYIMAGNETGPLLHLCGQELFGGLAQRLCLAGINTQEAVTYSEIPQLLTPTAQAILGGDRPVILPVFSPRTAAILISQLAALPSLAPLLVVTISATVAAAIQGLNPQQVFVADRPDASSMLAAIDRALMVAQAA